MQKMDVYRIAISLFSKGNLRQHPMSNII